MYARDRKPERTGAPEPGRPRPGLVVQRPIVSPARRPTEFGPDRMPVEGRVAARAMPRPMLGRTEVMRPHYLGLPVPRSAFGLPNLRRNVCPHFYITGRRGAIPIQAPHLLKALIRQEENTSRCQLRGGVHLEQSYVNDVCLTPRFNQCVFYEDELTRD
jgi:hypothetical protein